MTADAPKNDGYIRWRCKNCNQRLKVRETTEGGSVIPCPRCGQLVNVPIANIESLASAADMAETGQPGRLNVQADLLKERLTGSIKDMGGGPTLKSDEKWSVDTAFGRVQELDQILASVAKMDQDLVGQMQRLYRNSELEFEDRKNEVKRAAEIRRDEIRELFDSRFASLKQRISSMQAMHQRLGRSELDELERMKRAYEALQLYGGYVYGIKPAKQS
jgi:hypothetical protein